MRGYTLVETVAVIGLFMLLSITLGVFFVNFLTLYQQGLANPSYDAETIMSEVERLVLPAVSVLPSHAFTTGTYTTGTTTLVLQEPSVDSSGAVISGKYDYAVFYATGSSTYRLLEKDPASTRRAGTKYLSGLLSTWTFLYSAPNVADATSVDADVITASSVRGQTTTTHLNEDMYLRN